MRTEDIQYAFGIVLLVLVLWFAWAYFIYRTSTERLQMKVSSAFNKTSDGLTRDESKVYDVQVSNMSFSSPEYIGGTVTATVSFIPLPGITTPSLPARGPFTVTYNILEDSSDPIINTKNCKSASSLAAACIFI